jgi:hypothetical protein
MNSKVTFSSYDPVVHDTQLCDVCQANPPILHYELCAGDAAQDLPGKGFCCSHCAVELLKKVESAESQEWADEEAALKADDVDVSEFHRRRLASFAGGRRN